MSNQRRTQLQSIFLFFALLVSTGMTFFPHWSEELSGVLVMTGVLSLAVLFMYPENNHKSADVNKTKPAGASFPAKDVGSVNRSESLLQKHFGKTQQSSVSGKLTTGNQQDLVAVKIGYLSRESEQRSFDRRFTSG